MLTTVCKTLTHIGYNLHHRRRIPYNTHHRRRIAYNSHHRRRSVSNFQSTIFWFLPVQFLCFKLVFCSQGVCVSQFPVPGPWFCRLCFQWRMAWTLTVITSLLPCLFWHVFLSGSTTRLATMAINKLHITCSWQCYVICHIDIFWLSVDPSAMSPKKKAAAEAAQLGPTLPTTVNDDYLVDFQKALDSIREHKAFDNVLNKSPTDGNVPEFDEDEMKKAFSKGGAGSYMCSGNLFWIDFMFSTMRGVPFNRTNIMMMVNHQFLKPATFSTLEIAVTDGKKLEPKGSWRSVTPEEKLHAMIWAISRDINTESDKVIKEWLKAALSVTFKFSVIPTEGRGISCLQSFCKANYYAFVVAVGFMFFHDFPCPGGDVLSLCQHSRRDCHWSSNSHANCLSAGVRNCGFLWQNEWQVRRKDWSQTYRQAVCRACGAIQEQWCFWQSRTSIGAHDRWCAHDSPPWLDRARNWSGTEESWW